jgi:ribosomal protein L11 methylase PrmA
MVSANDAYMFIVYNDEPVRTQVKSGNDISVVFYNKQQVLVSERDWRNRSRKVFVPKNVGSRRYVISNWHKYRLYGN